MPGTVLMYPKDNAMVQLTPPQASERRRKIGAQLKRHSSELQPNFWLIYLQNVHGPSTALSAMLETSTTHH